MKKLLRTLLLWVGFSLPGFALANPILMLDPVYTEGSLGDVITIDILWDGSADPEYLGAWDIDLAFDSSILTFTGATFDFGVDSLGCIQGLSCDALTLGPGLIDLYEFSFDEAATLMANQDGLGNMFLLASLSFDAIGEGLTSVAFTGNLLTFGDELGDEIFPTLMNASVCIGNNGCIPTQIPEPTGLLLFLAGLFVLGIRKRSLK
ncbi:PEP-CTERM sorting domain-containing protein [Bowmanella dokdonensis]|uniref:PEP-CTERM sorting domain-containing protein n=1 Tax=Bowmanella dokdonensis TaxID=751969 RepID=A0A939ITC4_9ALTE|nr:PEP-CTERM sorting domain-containing protein [Bowmanella dokdonensis]MBN7827642.1 PEP-CTERM sorting domain-containing protein [Bowmanella dokdonensis]